MSILRRPAPQPGRAPLARPSVFAGRSPEHGPVKGPAPTWCSESPGRYSLIPSVPSSCVITDRFPFPINPASAVARFGHNLRRISCLQNGLRSAAISKRTPVCPCGADRVGDHPAGARPNLSAGGLARFQIGYAWCLQKARGFVVTLKDARCFDFFSIKTVAARPCTLVQVYASPLFDISHGPDHGRL